MCAGAGQAVVEMLRLCIRVGNFLRNILLFAAALHVAPSEL